MRDGTRLYEADEYPELPEPAPVREGKITVTRHKTFEAAIEPHKQFPGKKAAVLNFASASRPGGGAFRNDPNTVARAYRDALADWAKRFGLIEFAVYRSSFDTANSDTFRKILG